MEAEAGAPGAVWFEVTVEVVFVSSPDSAPDAVTFTLKVQPAPPARVAPVREMVLVPAVAVMVPPPQDPASPLGVETTSPAGSVSVKPTPVRLVVALGFAMVKVRLVVPLGRS